MTEKKGTPTPPTKPDGVITTQRNGQTIVAELFFNHNATETFSDKLLKTCLLYTSKSSAKKIELASVDDLFSTEEGRQDAKLEKIQEIPLSELHPFRNHPFKVKDDEAMMETADSIKQYGVLVPAIARPDPEGSKHNLFPV